MVDDARVEESGRAVTSPLASTERARQIVELLPVLRQWLTSTVQEASAECDLSLRQYAALRCIQEGATSPGELARLWQVTPAVLTGIVDRLEQRGLVRRAPDREDRRRLRLALTKEGAAASLDIERALTAALATQLASASPRELAELGRSLDLLRRALTVAPDLSERWRSPPPVHAQAGDEEWTIAAEPVSAVEPGG